jgi:hypothetical protein
MDTSHRWVVRKAFCIVNVILASIRQACWHISIIPALGRLRQEDHKFKVTSGYIARPCLKE